MTNHEAPLRNVNVEHRERLTPLEKAAVMITKRAGSMEFFLIVLVWTVVWLLWNVLAPKHLRFDPFPAFVFWLFISNLIQLLLAPLIMVAQNIEGKHDEARADADFEVNKRAKQEVEAVLGRLEAQNRLLVEIKTLLEKKR